VPHQRQAPLRRASLPWLSQAAGSEQAPSEPAQPPDSTETWPHRPRPALPRFLRGTAPPPAGLPRPVGAPPRSAAELRELAEVADLLGELAGLVQDLGALIVGLMSAASSVGGRPLRTFAMPAELAELTAAYQELRAGQRALSLRFEAALGGEEQATLRTSLAELTERATRAVASAAAVSFPAGEYPGGQDAGSQDAGRQDAGSPAAGGHYPGGPARPSVGTTPGASPARTAPRGSQAAPSREETDVQASASGTAPGTPGEQPVRWKAAASGSGRRLAPVAVALDAPDIDVAAHWATLVTPYVSTVKIGLELYLRYGPAVVATVRGGSGVQVFLDLKLHDIPNTVAGAARAVAKLRPEILTVHAAGGVEMIKAAVAAAPGTIVAGVTLLTSMGDKDLAELGLDGPVSDAVRRMAALAVGAGARGLVCSPQEVAAVRAEVGPDIMLITPGIRLAGAVSDDQARIATPEEALRAGADLLVVGRPITRAADPGAAAAAIAASLRRVTPVS
jgi:orotidine-5'-phosphate decarboxylase